MQAAKDHIQTIIYDMREQHFGAAFEVGFVGYRDYGSDEQYIVIDFTEPEQLVRKIRPIQPKEGDDEAEDVAWGLRHARKLTWGNAPIKMVYHIADAPAHGEFFHRGNVSDRFPEGDPRFLDPRQSIKEWSYEGYHYTFVRITRTTDTMIDHFHNAWTGNGTFRVIDLSHRGPNGFLDAIRDSVNETLTQHISTQDPGEE